MSLDTTDIDYINSTNYTTLVGKIRNLKDVSIDLTNKALASRKLRYAEIDIEVQRKAGNIAPDEVYLPTSSTLLNLLEQ